MDIRHSIDWNIHNITVHPAGSPTQDEPSTKGEEEEMDEIVVDTTPLPEIVDEEEETSRK